MMLIVVFASLTLLNCSGTKGNDSSSASSSGNSGKPLELKLSPEILEDGVQFIPSPDPVAYGSDGSNPIVSFKWSVPDAKTTEIHMQSPTGSIFARANGAGTAVTGAWVQAKSVFYLQDVSKGAPGKTVAVMRVEVCPSCKL